MAVSWDDEDYFFYGGATSVDFKNIAPGGKKQITLALGSKPIDAAHKSKKIKTKIRNYDSKTLEIREWEDTSSFTYYKAPVPFLFRSEQQVQGVIKAPRGKTYYFRTERSGSAGDYAAAVSVPWSTEEYTVTFLGAKIETESATKYSFAVNGQPPSDWESLRPMDFLSEYKPANQYEKSAPVLAWDRPFMGYLAGDSIDYYKVRLGDEPPEISFVTVFYFSNGGSYVPAQEVNLGGTATRPADPGRTGYAFDNWYNDSGLTTAYDFSAPVNGNITLYAKWIAILTVTFDTNGGTDVAAQEVNSGGVATRPADPSRSGYAFDNWYNDSGLTVVYDFSAPVTGNITLYAKWDEDAGNGGGGTVPNAPSNVSAVATSASSITVSWSPVSGATGYYVYRSTSVSGTYSLVGTTVSTTSYTNTGLLAGTTYYYQVAALDGFMLGPRSTSVSATTSSVGTVLNAPSNVSAVATSASSITVSWSPVSGATTYIVSRNTSASGTFNQAASTSLTYKTFTDLPAGTTYYYQVAATDGVRIGTRSASVSATTSLSDVAVTVRNNTGYFAQSMTAKPATASSWGGDLLDSREELGHGSSKIIRLASGTYDIRLWSSEYSGDTTHYFSYTKRVSMTSNTTVTFDPSDRDLQ